MSERRRSFWGWGYEDAFPDKAERERLAMVASAALGGVSLAPREPPTLASISLPLPRLEPPAALATLVATDAYSRAAHSYGKSFRDLSRGLAGDFSAAPDMVATPSSEEDVERILEWAGRDDIAVIPYGGGTSVVGGVEAAVGSSFAAALSLDLAGLGGVREIDEVSLLARIGAGARGPDLEEELAASDLTLRFYPQSFEFSTLGGWIATRAGGHFATVETHIDDLVSATRAVTPSGLWQTRCLPASGAGPAPDRLLVGSEGALGVITEAWMRVRRRPTQRTRASLAFAEFDAAVGALHAIAQARLYPANCRLLDAREAMLHQVFGAPGKHLVLLGFEAADRQVDGEMAQAIAICVRLGGEIIDRGESAASDASRGSGASEDWRAAFLRTPYLFSALVSLGLVVDTFETAVSWSRFEALNAAVRAAAHDTMKRLRGHGVVSSRITHVYPDGLAPYYTFITTAERGEELEVWSAVKSAVSEAIFASGGTITHHHAVGRMHDPWYQRETPPLFGRALAAVKAELDPRGILNPGVLVPIASDRSRQR